MTRRDTYQRKAYGIHHMSLAVERLNRATSREDRVRGEPPDRNMEHRQACLFVQSW
jgi:hypothetical protein